VPASPQGPAGGKSYGVNQSQGAFGNNPWNQQGRYGCDYGYPGVPGDCGYSSPNGYQYFASRGLPLVRFAFRQGNLQPGAGANPPFPDFDPGEVARIRQSLDVASAQGAKVFMAVWSSGCPTDTDANLRTMDDRCYTDFWTKIVTTFGNHPAIWGWEVIDNEPNNWGGWGDTDYGKQRFAQVAQEVVNSIRTTGDSHWILVPGLGSQNAEWWPDRNPYLDVTDPLNHFAYSAHTYWNCANPSYVYDGCGSPTIGVDQIQPFVNWIKQKNAQGKYARGMFSEFGVPHNDSRWFTALDNFYSYVDSEPLLIGGTYWSAGVGWCNSGDLMYVEPCGGQDRPQMPALIKHPSTS
jgi:endoglucanase